MRDFFRGTLEYLFPQQDQETIAIPPVLPGTPSAISGSSGADVGVKESRRSAFEVLLNSADRVPTPRPMEIDHTATGNMSSEKAQLAGVSKENTSLGLAFGAGHPLLSNLPEQKPARKKRKLSGNARLSSGDVKQSTLPATIVKPNKSNESVEAAIGSDAVGQGIRPVLSTPPKKMMRIKADGKLVSPKMAAEKSLKPSPRRKKTLPTRLVAVCRYAAHAHESDIGEQIDNILQRPVVNKTPTKYQPMVVPGTRGQGRTAHPFFSTREKRVRKLDTTAPSAPPNHARKESAATPGKIRAQLADFRATRETVMTGPAARTGTKSRSTGHPAPWPTRQTQHVRGDQKVCTHPNHVVLPPRRKMKYHQRPAGQNDAIARIRTLTQRASASRIRPDGFKDPPEALRLPDKLLSSGDDVKARLPRDMSDATPISSLLKDLPSMLTPWDNGTSEICAWTTKYAPRSTSAVLQQGREPQLLADWLQSLTTSSVGRLAASVTQANHADAKPKRKRRKTHDDLDDFIVASDDEGMGELEELEPLEYTLGTRNCRDEPERTVVRTYRGPLKGTQSRIANLVVVSGQHGCGKTAMIQAVAKEQGFEIFEINAGSRRSGKDIIERVGDMAGNHLVQQRQEADPNAASSDEANKISRAAVEADVASGKQGRMTSFFTISNKSIETAKKSRKRSAVIGEQVGQPKVKPSRQQKQSLILLEEVDVLYEEDKGFWPTIMSLIASSKRPVVMTCTDERLVPWQDLILHAIMRLSPPKADLVADYLICMAATEGHLLTRSAVANLYESKGRDLRASITALQFWCQMGVGDPRGGLGWIYQRWPPGRGVDKHGKTLRVISRNTFLQGMGQMPEASDDEPRGTIGQRTSRCLELWNELSEDPRDRLYSSAASNDNVHCVQLDQEEKSEARLTALRRIASLSQTLSDLDYMAPFVATNSDRTTSTWAAVQKPYQANIDLTTPGLTNKTRADYIEGYRLLQTNDIVDHADIRMELCATTSLIQADIVHADIESVAEVSGRKFGRLDESSCRLSRVDFGALDALAEPAGGSSASGLVYCIFDGPLRDIVVDIAPYVRSIARYDVALEEQRDQLSNAGSQPSSQGQGAKKSRTTRAARSALEGGQRQTTRRERWFTPGLDLSNVLETGGRDWGRRN